MASRATGGCTSRSLSNNTPSGSPTTLFSLTTMWTLFSYWAQLLQSRRAEVDHQLLVFHQSGMGGKNNSHPSGGCSLQLHPLGLNSSHTETDGVKTEFEHFPFTV